MPKPLPRHLRRIANDLDRLAATAPEPKDAGALRPLETSGSRLAEATRAPSGAPSGRLATPNWWGRRSRGEKVAIGVGGGAAVGGAAYAVHRRGRKVEKSFSEVRKASYSADGTAVQRVTARTPSGKFVSHTNDLDVFHVTPKRNPTSRVLVARKGGDAASKPWVTKALKTKSGYSVSSRAMGRKLEKQTAEIDQALARRRGTGVGRKLSA